MLHYIHITHHTIILNQDRSFRNKQTANHSTVSPSTLLRLRGLAQVRQSRSGEFPLRLGEGTRSGAWATRDLAQARPLSPGRVACSLKILSGTPERPLAQVGLGESLFVSPRRDWLAQARLTGLIIVSPATTMYFEPTKHTKHSSTPNRRIHPYNQ